MSIQDIPKNDNMTPRPRTGPIVWGSLILVFCALVVVRVLGGTIDATAWIITTVFGIGALLLIVGLVVLVRGNSGRGHSGSSDRSS